MGLAEHALTACLAARLLLPADGARAAALREIPTPVVRLAPSPVVPEARPTFVGRREAEAGLEPPSLVSALPSAGGVLVRWSRTGAPDVGHHVYLSTDRKRWQKVTSRPVETNEHVVASLPAAKKVYLGVRAVAFAEGAREGAMSRPVEFSPAAEAALVDVRREGETLRIRVGDQVLFHTGKTALLPRSEAVLGRVADLIRTFPGARVVVEGHTDDRSIAGALARLYPDNRALSESRAFAVKARLSERGVPLGWIAAEGHGDSRPVADNGTASGRAQNRRVEIRVEPGEP